MSFKSFITELFNAPLPFTGGQFNGIGHFYKFKVADENYTLTILANSSDDFEDVDPDYTERLIKKLPADKQTQFLHGYYDVTFTNDTGRFDIQGGKQSIAVMSTVVAILKDFITKNRPKFIYFNSVEPSRTRLYRHVIQRLQGKHYEIQGDESQHFLVVI